jgi:hypothetical protein
MRINPDRLPDPATITVNVWPEDDALAADHDPFAIDYDTAERIALMWRWIEAAHRAGYPHARCQALDRAAWDQGGRLRLGIARIGPRLYEIMLSVGTGTVRAQRDLEEKARDGGDVGAPWRSMYQVRVLAGRARHVQYDAEGPEIGYLADALLAIADLMPSGTGIHPDVAYHLERVYNRLLDLVESAEPEEDDDRDEERSSGHASLTGVTWLSPEMLPSESIEVLRVLNRAYDDPAAPGHRKRALRPVLDALTAAQTMAMAHPRASVTVTRQIP